MLPQLWFNSALNQVIVDIQWPNSTRTRRNEPKRDAYTTGGAEQSCVVSRRPRKTFIVEMSASVLILA